jgi:hypothetical protein
MKTSMAVLALALAVPPFARAEEPPAPAFSGRWTLDTEKSEDGRAKMREALAQRGGRGGGPRGGGAGGGYGGGAGGGGARGGGGHGGRGGPGGAPGGDAFRETMRTLVEAPPALTITQTPQEITILEEDGRLRALHPDHKEYKGTGGEKIETRWDGARLVVETRSEHGPRLVETFEGGAEELVAVARLEGGRGEPVSVRRVYRRAPPSQ